MLPEHQSSWVDNVETIDDPTKEIDSLLAKEMLALDLKERTAIQEEVHGVQNNFFVDTPETRAKALDDLRKEIDRIPASEKAMFLRSQEIPGSYIQSEAFLLKLLRSTGFHIPRSAIKIIELCNVMVELFGEIILHRPVRLSDLSKKDLQFFRSGRIQFLPFADRIGRRILAIFPDEVFESIPAESWTRIVFYLSWTASEDLEAQIKGIIILVWCDVAFNPSSRPQLKYKNHVVHITRPAAVHLCFPDTPFHRLKASVVAIRLGRSRRSSRTHHGNSTENRYALQSFGIVSDQIPISYSGKVKLGYIRQWLGVRRIIEEEAMNPVPPKDPLIEYPQQHDVVFRQGSSCSQHSANYAFRNVIIAKVEEQELSRKLPGAKIRRKKIVLDVIDEVMASGKGRFLIWNENGGWNVLTDQEIIHSKIEYLIKEFRKSVRAKLQKSRPETNLSSDTSIFRSDYQSMLPNPNSIGPLDLANEVDEKKLAEAASCVANCFNMKKQESFGFFQNF